MSITLDLTDLISGLLILILLYLGFRLIEMKWSYKISKPYAWDEAIKAGKVPSDLIKIERTYRDKVRFYTLWLQLERIKKEQIPGDFAELGVFQGETAKMIHQIDPDRSLHLFDTFEGFSQKDIDTANSHEAKLGAHFSETTLDEVKAFVGPSKKVYYYPGYFPDTTAGLEDKTFAFVHLDADLYNPTLAGLEYFYPRLAPGGAILIHDYHHTWAGVPKAVHEFCAWIPEMPVAVADWQGSAIIVKNS